MTGLPRTASAAERLERLFYATLDGFTTGLFTREGQTFHLLDYRLDDGRPLSFMGSERLTEIVPLVLRPALAVRDVEKAVPFALKQRVMTPDLHQALTDLTIQTTHLSRYIDPEEHAA